jgi:hypothetical protein
MRQERICDRVAFHGNRWREWSARARGTPEAAFAGQPVEDVLTRSRSQPSLRRSTLGHDDVLAGSGPIEPLAQVLT